MAGRKQSSSTVATMYLGAMEDNSWRGVFPSRKQNSSKTMSSNSSRKLNLLSRADSGKPKRQGSQLLDAEYHVQDTDVSTAALVRKEVHEMFASSPYFENVCQRISKFPKFNVSQELEMGLELGRGEFGVVREIRSVTLHSESQAAEVESAADMAMRRAALAARKMALSNHTDASASSLYSQDEEEGRAFISEHCVRKNCGTPRYAIKLMSPNHGLSSPKGYHSMRDLAVEAHFLASVEHANIIKLRGLSTEEIGHAGFAIVLDKLYDTLESRIHKTWKSQDKKLKNLSGKLFKDPKGKKRQIMWQDRLKYAHDIASAILYLHERNIMHRDLKPANMGFDVRGDVRLFDFGLAKEFTLAKINTDSHNVRFKTSEGGFMKPSPLYKHTACSGTKRYMAPENFLGQPYNESTDIYSFGLILWEILELEKPYGVLDSKTFACRVIQQGIRPCISENTPKDVRVLMEQCWLDPHVRPTAKELHASLRDVVSSWSGQTSQQENDDSTRRRSTFKQKRFYSLLTQQFQSSKRDLFAITGKSSSRNLTQVIAAAG